MIASSFQTIASVSALKTQTTRRSKVQTVVTAKAEDKVDRRAALALFTAAAVSTVAKSANANLTIPSQSSVGGFARRTEFAGEGFVGSSTASMSSYTMEGTAKLGADLKSRRKTMSKARAKAEATIAASSAAPAKKEKK
ncbi:unnamed protein product [Bathycoccus prasinos]